MSGMKKRTILVQAVLPFELGKRLQKTAQSSGLSVAAWLRSHLLRVFAEKGGKDA